MSNRSTVSLSILILASACCCRTEICILSPCSRHHLRWWLVCLAIAPIQFEIHPVCFTAALRCRIKIKMLYCRLALAGALRFDVFSRNT